MARVSLTEQARLFDNLVWVEGDHWLFKPHTQGVYGRMDRDKQPGQPKVTVSAHIVSWEFFKSEVPPGLEVDHLCRITRCCNPDHLEPVPKRVNILRSENPPAVNARKEFCIHGHPLSGDNLRIRPNGNRGCRTCDADSKQRWLDKNRHRRREIKKASRARVRARQNQNLMDGVQGGN